MNDSSETRDGTKQKESLSKVMKTASTKRVVTGGMILTTVDIIGSLFFTLYNMAVARIDDPSESAVLSIVSQFQSMLKIFAMLGFIGAGSKFISEYLERDIKEARKYGMSAAKYNFLAIGLPIIGLSILIFFIMAQEEDPLTTQAFFILIFLTIVDRLRSCSDLYLLGYQRYDIYAIVWGLNYGGMYLLAFFLLPIIGPAGPLIAWTLGTLSMFIMSMISVSRISDFPVRDMFSWHKEHGLFNKMFSFNFLYALANLCFALLTTTLFVTTGKLLGFLTDQEITSLNVISTFSNILINVFGIVAGIQPAVSQAFALKNKKLMKNYFLASVKFPLLMSVAVITFFLIFGQEMITIFYSRRYIVIGLLIMVFLIPSYAIGTYASRYDNILAGIGRPETAIIPWFVGMAVAVGGIFIVQIFVPKNFYLVDFYYLTKEGLFNYGITLHLVVGLLFMAIGLTIPGIWIVRISIKVLDIDIPRAYFSKPIISALLTSFIMIPVKIFVPLRGLLDNLIGDTTIGGLIYTVAMILIGVLIYLAFEILLGGFTLEDGRFWKSVIKTMPLVGKLLIPIFAYGKFLLKRVPTRFRAEEYKWITSTKHSEMEKDMEFLIEDDFEELHASELKAGEKVEFSIKFKDVKQTFHHVLTYAKIDMKIINESMIYRKKIDNDETVTLSFTLPEDLKPGHHELYIDAELYTRPSDKINRDKLMSKSTFWKYFSFVFKWMDEKIKYILLVEPGGDAEHLDQESIDMGRIPKI
ncbi:MAG: lipopolysaccharide biosynthesis protein [Candidatus Hodarchaeota archaeon]